MELYNRIVMKDVIEKSLKVYRYECRMCFPGGSENTRCVILTGRSEPLYCPYGSDKAIFKEAINADSSTGRG